MLVFVHHIRFLCSDDLTDNLLALHFDANKAPSMDAAKAKQLEEYLIVLERQAQSLESQGRGNEAVKTYVKLVDVLLLLAREAPDHQTWVKYSTKAESLQKKAKEAMLRPQPQNDSSSQTGRTVAIKKIFGLKSGEVKSSPYDMKLNESYEPSSLQSKVSTNTSGGNLNLQEQVIPKQLYDELLEKNRNFESRIASMVDRSEYGRLEALCRELNEKLAEAVPKFDYEQMSLKLADSVPREQHEELQRMLTYLVPKDAYDSALIRISELESQLANSIPRSVMDNLAKEISLIAVAAIIPIELVGAGEDIVAHPQIMPELDQGEPHLGKRRLYFSDLVEDSEIQDSFSGDSLLS